MTHDFCPVLFPVCEPQNHPSALLCVSHYDKTGLNMIDETWDLNGVLTAGSCGFHSDDAGQTSKCDSAKTYGSRFAFVPERPRKVDFHQTLKTFANPYQNHTKTLSRLKKSCNPYNQLLTLCRLSPSPAPAATFLQYITRNIIVFYSIELMYVEDDRLSMKQTMICELLSFKLFQLRAKPNTWAYSGIR